MVVHGAGSDVQHRAHRRPLWGIPKTGAQPDWRSRPDDLSHAFVSLLLAEGRSVLDVAAQAGHAPSLSFDTYGHLMADLEGEANRPAEDVIWEAREAGVRWVCDDGSADPADDSPKDDESPAFVGLS